MELLKGSVPSSEIARVVGENGISFRMSDELESQFREAGATDELIDALKKASKPEETTPTAPATGTLKIQSQPGEAQVYVNDEPKGMTSPAGELRLSGMAPGTYRLRVALAGYKTWENSVTVTAGETVTPFVTLEKQNLVPTVTLDADRSSIETGQSVYLRWTSINATDVDIEPGVGKVALAGATSVSPRESTTYTLTAIGPGGIKTATTYVSVTTPPPPRSRWFSRWSATCRVSPCREQASKRSSFSNPARPYPRWAARLPGAVQSSHHPFCRLGTPPYVSCRDLPCQLHDQCNLVLSEWCSVWQ